MVAGSPANDRSEVPAASATAGPGGVQATQEGAAGLGGWGQCEQVGRLGKRAAVRAAGERQDPHRLPALPAQGEHWCEGGRDGENLIGRREARFQRSESHTESGLYPVSSGEQLEPCEQPVNIDKGESYRPRLAVGMRTRLQQETEPMIPGSTPRRGLERER